MVSTSTLAGHLTGSHAGHLSGNQSGQLPDIHSGRLVGGEIYGGLAGNPIAGCSMTGSHFSGIRPLVQRGFFPDLSSQAFAEGEKQTPQVLYEPSCRNNAIAFMVDECTHLKEHVLLIA